MRLEWRDMTLPVDCWFSQRALWKSNSACWSSTKQTSFSPHQNVACFCHYMVSENNNNLLYRWLGFFFPDMLKVNHIPIFSGHMVVAFTTSYAISACHHYHCEFWPPFMSGVLDTTLCNKVCQWLVVFFGYSGFLPIKLTATI